MHLKRIEVEGYRASANAPIGCELSGRFSLTLGANGSRKTTINEAIAVAHPRSFPRLAPIDAIALGSTHGRFASSTSSRPMLLVKDT